MRSFLSLAAVLLAGVANAVSSSGDRLLVVLDVASKVDYSKFFADLEGMLSHAVVFLRLHAFC